MKTSINRQKASEKLGSGLDSRRSFHPYRMGVMQEFRSAWGEESPAVRKKIGSRARTIDPDEFRSSKLSLAVVTSEFQGLVDPCDRFTILVVTRL